MLVLRIVGALLIVIIGISMVAFVITKDAKWKRFAWQTIRFGAIILLIFMALYALERLVVIV
ncbi:MAG TPA: hypothetical protein VEW72_01195 [Burkholderiales bacterium]|jgi:hypothetical protein|nr:hypothetical protein [Burkholderiales bacterium]